ncbi:hypothetical protein AB4084_17310, partial [Lysobacter sp. 2RAB21]
ASGEQQLKTAKARVPYAEVLLARGDAAGMRQQLQSAAPVLRRELHRESELLRRLNALESGEARLQMAVR